MIGKINKGNHIYSTIKYVAFKDGTKILSSNMAGSTPYQLAHEFEYFSNKNQRTERPVFHLSINPHPDDRALTEYEYCDIAADIRTELGFDDSSHQYLLALHTDAFKEDSNEIRPHLHLVVNRIDFQGKCKSDYLDYIEIQKACRKIEEKYGLITQPHSWEMSEKKGPLSKRDEIKFIQDAIKKAAADKPEMPTFISRLQAQDVDVQCRITRTGKLQGISYAYNDKAFKGRQLGKSFTHQGIQSQLGVIHKSSHKEQIELLINTPKGETNSTSQSTTDNTNVVVPKQKSYKSVVPSAEQMFGTWESNKAKKQLDNKPKNNKQGTHTENTEPVAPPRKAYKSVVPGIEEDFPSPLSNENEKIKASEPSDALHVVGESSQTQHESSLHRIEENFDNPSNTEPEVTNTEHTQPVKTAPEPEAVELAVKIAGYMGSTNELELKGESMRANLSFDDNISTLEVRRNDSNEIILSANHTISGGWVINNSLKFTEEEKKRINQLQERTNVPMQQPVNEKKGFEQ
ncbi:MAG: relaxase/mobilization nuclease domain-containing protein [Cyanobacteria bacterium P01_C01_bin.38]